MLERGLFLLISDSTKLNIFKCPQRKQKKSTETTTKIILINFHREVNITKDIVTPTFVLSLSSEFENVRKVPTLNKIQTFLYFCLPCSLASFFAIPVDKHEKWIHRRWQNECKYIYIIHMYFNVLYKTWAEA